MTVGNADKTIFLILIFVRQKYRLENFENVKHILHYKNQNALQSLILL